MDCYQRDHCSDVRVEVDSLGAILGKVGFPRTEDVCSCIHSIFTDY